MNPRTSFWRQKPVSCFPAKCLTGCPRISRLFCTVKNSNISRHLAGRGRETPTFWRETSILAPKQASPPVNIKPSRPNFQRRIHFRSQNARTSPALQAKGHGQKYAFEMSMNGAANDACAHHKPMRANAVLTCFRGVLGSTLGKCVVPAAAVGAHKHVHHGTMWPFATLTRAMHVAMKSTWPRIAPI